MAAAGEDGVIEAGHIAGCVNVRRIGPQLIINDNTSPSSRRTPLPSRNSVFGTEPTLTTARSHGIRPRDTVSTSWSFLLPWNATAGVRHQDKSAPALGILLKVIRDEGRGEFFKHLCIGLDDGDMGSERDQGRGDLHAPAAGANHNGILGARQDRLPDGFAFGFAV